VWLGSAERPQPLVRAVANERLETETNRVGICLSAGSRLGIPQQPLVDVERLLHTYDGAMDVWLKGPSPGSLASDFSSPVSCSV
jgi:hypothetical protein